MNESWRESLPSGAEVAGQGTWQKGWWLTEGGLRNLPHMSRFIYTTSGVKGEDFSMSPGRCPGASAKSVHFFTHPEQMFGKQWKPLWTLQTFTVGLCNSILAEAEIRLMWADMWCLDILTLEVFWVLGSMASWLSVVEAQLSHSPWFHPTYGNPDSVGRWKDQSFN